MKFILISFLLFCSVQLFADVTMHKRVPRPIPVHPIVPERPVDRPVVVRPYVDTAFVDNRIINNNYESCEPYKKQIDELNAYIDGLEAQIAEFKEKEYAKQREKLKKENAEELKKFDNRKSSVKSKNSIEITPK